MLEEIKNYAAGLDTTDRLLFAQKLRKLAAELEGTPQGVGMAARARATASELRAARDNQAQVVGKLGRMKTALDADL